MTVLNASQGAEDHQRDLLDLGGRICLVTGAGQGVGRQAALHLAAHNAGGVVVNDFYQERADQVAREIEAAGQRALSVQGDVSDLAAVQDMVRSAEATFGGIDVVVNNAGNMGPDPSAVSQRPFWETDPDEWDRWVGVNFFGVANTVRAALPGMIERGRGGRVVTVISDAGRVGEARMAVYSGAKAGAAGFMRALAREAARFGITANCVAIAATRTPTILAALDPETEKAVAKAYPLRRLGEPEDVANMILFLSSDAASWITGQTYPVNGGFSFNQ